MKTRLGSTLFIISLFSQFIEKPL